MSSDKQYEGHDLVVDCSHLLYRTFYANQNEASEIIMGLAMHSAFITIRKYFNMFKPDRIVMGFDRSNWRLAYTKSDECYSKRIYKGERRKDQTPQQAAKYAAFKRHIQEFEQIMADHTTIITLGADGLEGDDCCGGWVIRHPERKITVISGDNDYIQLLQFENVSLFDPAKQKEIVCEDPHYHLFLKLFRGESKSTDNICPAYPKVRETRIRKAYEDPFELTNIRQETWKDHDGRIMEVGKLLDENKLLMDLTAQPEHIQDLLDEVIAKASLKKKKFSHFHFMKFLGKYELKRIADQLELFVPMFSK